MIYLTPDTCITWHMHDYCIITRHLVILYLLYSCIPVLLYLLYSCAPVSPVLMLLLITQSFRRPAEHAWCRYDEDVSHNRASIRWFLNGTKSHTEQSATSHTWWGHLLNLWGSPLESIPHTERSATQSKVPHHTRGGGHLLNLWGPLLESVELLSPSCLYPRVLA